jgi:hypothetical protein
VTTPPDPPMRGAAGGPVAGGDDSPAPADTAAIGRSSDVWDGQPVSEHSPPPVQQTPAAALLGAVEAELPRRGNFTVAGTVSSMHQRTEMHRRLPTSQIVNFRLERYDGRGNRLQPVPVEMRGITVTGHVAEGERVQLSGKFFNGILYAKRLTNLTTGGALSTQAAGRFGRFLGRRSELGVVAGILVVLLLCVRFIPQAYANTPFGLHEYRDDVHSTCEHLTATAQAQTSLVVAPNGKISRSSLIEGYDAKVSDTQETYRLLFSHVTPLISRSRRNRVESLMPALNRYFAAGRALLTALPPRVSVDQLEKANATLAPTGAAVSARLNDAMTQLARGSCHVD